MWIWSILLDPVLISIIGIISNGIFQSRNAQADKASKEVNAINQFRNLLKDGDISIPDDPYYMIDSFLMRWIRAKDWDLNAAKKMLLNASDWRKHNKIDSILTETTIDFQPPVYTFHGFDNERRPVLLFTPRNADIRKVLANGRRAALIRYWDQMLERSFHELRKANDRNLMNNGKEVTQFVVIADCHGYNIRQHFCMQCVPVYIEWLHHYENYYPGALKYFVIINLPKIAIPLIELMKPFLSIESQKALIIFGTNRSEWSKFLHSIISADQLPYQFGGTKPSDEVFK